MPDFSKLKICFLAGTLEHGGAERQLYYMLQALCRHGATARVLCFDRGEFWEEPIRSLGVPVTWVGQHQSRLARLVRVLSELRKDPPDVFQSQHFYANAYAGLSAYFLQLRGIGALRSDGGAELLKNGPIGGWLNLHLPRIIAANSQLAMQQVMARGVAPSRLYFLPNVVDTQRFRPSDGAADRPLTLIAVGRLVKEKRFERFISVLGRLRTDLNLNVRGLIVGPVQDGDLRKDLETQAVKLGLFPRHLEFMDGVSDMGPFYRQTHVCVLTSDFEGTPNVLLEAMASGLPVVATNVGGVPAIVEQGKTGFLLDGDDMDGLVAALIQLVRNPTLRTEMGRRARCYVEEKHSLQCLPAYLGKLYEMALPGRHHWKRGVIAGFPSEIHLTD